MCNSIQKQTFINWFIVIVDNAPTDYRALNVLSKNEKIKLLRNEKNVDLVKQITNEQNGVIKTNYILNKINIYIVDLIGIKSGMHYYHSSLQNLFKANGYALRILSNYNCGNNQFFPFIFSGNFFIKIIKVFNAV